MIEGHTISIPLARYKELLEAENMLSSLEAAGVDNWEGYSYACELMGQTEDQE